MAQNILATSALFFLAFLFVACVFSDEVGDKTKWFVVIGFFSSLIVMFISVLFIIWGN